MAEQNPKYMMRRYDLSNGMDTSTNPFMMDDLKFTYLKNINHDEYGALSKDGGYSTYKDSSGTTQDDLVFDYVNLNGVHTPVKVNNGKIYKAVEGSNVWTEISGSTLTAGDHCRAVNFLGNMYICDEGKTNILYTNGTAVTSTYADNGNSNVRGTCMAVLENYLFVGDITTVHGRNEVVQSMPGTHVFFDVNKEGFNTYATTDRVISVDGRVIGLKAYQGLMFIFTEDALWYYNPDTTEVKRLADTGCTSHDSIKEIDGVLYWAGRNGVYRFTGNGMPAIISLPITNWGVNSLWTLLDGDNWYNLQAGVLDGKYYLWIGDLTGALPGDVRDIQPIQCDYLELQLTNVSGNVTWYAGSNSVDSGDNTGWVFEDAPTSAAENLELKPLLEDVVLVYDTYRSAWSFYDNHPVSSWATIVDNTGNNKLIFGSNTDGQTYMRDYSYTHAGDAIESVIRTKYFDFDNPEAEKVLGDLYVSYRPEGLTSKYLKVGVSVNGNNYYKPFVGEDTNTKLPLTGSTLLEYQFERVSLSGLRGRTISFEFSNGDYGVNNTLLGFSQQFTYILPNLNYTTE
jgi:hypothetical protein